MCQCLFVEVSVCTGSGRSCTQDVDSWVSWLTHWLGGPLEVPHGSRQSMFLAKASKMWDLKALTSDMWGWFIYRGSKSYIFVIRETKHEIWASSCPCSLLIDLTFPPQMCNCSSAIRFSRDGLRPLFSPRVSLSSRWMQGLRLEWPPASYESPISVGFNSLSLGYIWPLLGAS